MKNWPAYLQVAQWTPALGTGPGCRAKAGERQTSKTAKRGLWLAKGDAVARADLSNQEVEAWRQVQGGVRDKPARIKQKAWRTCEQLHKLYLKSPKWAKLASSSKVDYTSKLKIFLNTKLDDADTRFGDVPLAAIETSHLYLWWEKLHEQRGHAMANGTIRVVSAMFSHGRRIGWRKDNPAMQLGLDGVAPRVVVWSPSEIAHLVETADGMGLPSVADAVILALHTGQRRGDVLALEMPAIAGGRSIFRRRSAARASPCRSRRRSISVSLPSGAALRAGEKVTELKSGAPRHPRREGPALRRRRRRRSLRARLP